MSSRQLNLLYCLDWTCVLILENWVAIQHLKNRQAIKYNTILHKKINFRLKVNATGTLRYKRYNKEKVIFICGISTNDYRKLKVWDRVSYSQVNFKLKVNISYNILESHYSVQVCTKINYERCLMIRNMQIREYK